MAPGGLVEVRVSWSGHPRYLKKKKANFIGEKVAIAMKFFSYPLFKHGCM